MSATTASNSPFLNSVSDYMAVRHYGKRTIRSYLYWIRYFIVFHKMRHPNDMGATEVELFLTHLAVTRKVSVSTQKVALNALAFLYNRVLEQPFGELGEFNRSHKARNLPVVLTRGEVSRLLQCMTGVSHLLASLLYGSGLRRPKPYACALRMSILITTSCRSGMARDTIIVSPPWHPNCRLCYKSRLSVCACISGRIASIRSLPVCGCPMRWRASIRMLARHWAGSIFFRL